MKKVVLSLFVLNLLFNQIQGQNRSFQDVVKYRTQFSGEILENEKITGYYAFYQTDKVSRKTDAYNLEIMDNNLNLVKTIPVIRPQHSYLVDASYNGKAFLIMYFHDGDVDVVTYDKAGKQLGEKKYDDLPKAEKYKLQMAQQQDDANPSIYPLGQRGFVRQAWAKNDKYGYVLEAYSNDMKTLWTCESDPKSELLEGADIIYSSDKYIVANVTKAQNRMGKNMEAFLMVVDATNGKKIFEKPLKEDVKLSLNNCFIDTVNNQFGVFGEYYMPSDDILKAKSVGVYFMLVDIKGATKNFKKMSWALDVKKFRTVDLDAKDKTLTYFHRVFRTDDGKIFAIGEQYKKQGSAAGIANKVLSGGRSGSSVAEIKVMGMVVLQLDASYNLVDFKIFDKKTTTVELPAGAAYMSPTLLAMYIKQSGGFDYNFSTISDSKEKFYVVYTDFNHKDEDGKKADTMLGIVKYEDGKLTNERVPINTDASMISFNPAKVGYVEVSEYNKKKKTLSLRLEKISY